MFNSKILKRSFGKFEMAFDKIKKIPGLNNIKFSARISAKVRNSVFQKKKKNQIIFKGKEVQLMTHA